MANKLIVAMEVSDPGVGQSLIDALHEVPDLDIVKWQSRIAGNEALAARAAAPHILLVEDRAEIGNIFKRLSTLKGTLPQTAIFVVSDDKRPERIVDVMKAGADEYLVVPLDPKPVQDAVEDVRVQVSNAMTAVRGPVYSFISSKGGVGATLLAVNTAVALARKKDVAAALCDLSFQSGDAALLLDLAPENSMVDLCRNFGRMDTALVRQVMTRHGSGLELLAAPYSLVDAEEVGMEHLEMTFGLLRKLYDYIVVDCASITIDDCTNEAFKISDKIFIVTDFSVNALRNAARLFQTVARLGLSPRNIEFIGNRFSKHDNLSLKEAERALPKPLFWLFPNAFSDAIASINCGTPLVLSHPHSLLAKSVEQFIDKLQYPDKYAAYRGAKGAFGKDL